MPSKPVIYAFIAMWLYALQSVIIDVRLSKYSTMALLLYWYFTLAPLAVAGLGFMYFTKQKIVMPNSSDMFLAVAVGIMFFLADIFYISAYTNGGKLLAITTLVVLCPAIAQFIKFVWIGGSLNRYHVIGYIFAAAAVILINKGSASN